jgi:hypothetical protein
MNCTRRGGATVARNTYILEKKMKSRAGGFMTIYTVLVHTVYV